MEDEAMRILLDIAADTGETTEDRISAAGWVLGHLDSRRDRELARSISERQKCCGAPS